MESQPEIRLETRRFPKLFKSSCSSDSTRASSSDSESACHIEERSDKKRQESKPLSREVYYNNLEWFDRNRARVREDIIQMEIRHKWHLEEAKRLIPRIQKFRERVAEIDETRQAFMESYHVEDN